MKKTEKHTDTNLPQEKEDRMIKNLQENTTLSRKMRNKRAP